jgi:hypothetical protein
MYAVGCTLYYMMTGIYIYLFSYFYFIYRNIIIIFNIGYLLGKHPFINSSGLVNVRKQIEGKYEKVEEGKYSSGLITLMEKMLDVVGYHILYLFLFFQNYLFYFIFLL